MCDDEENDYKAYEHEYHKGNYSLNRYREPEYLDYDKYYHKHDRPYELRSRGYEYDDYSDMEMRRMKMDREAREKDMHSKTQSRDARNTSIRYF